MGAVMQRVITPGAGLDPGEYRQADSEVRICCPRCAGTYLLEHGPRWGMYQIRADGKVTPEVDCPICGLAEWLTLESWQA